MVFIILISYATIPSQAWLFARMMNKARKAVPSVVVQGLIITVLFTPGYILAQLANYILSLTNRECLTTNAKLGNNITPDEALVVQLTSRVDRAKDLRPFDLADLPLKSMKYLLRVNNMMHRYANNKQKYKYL